MLFAWATMIS